LAMDVIAAGGRYDSLLETFRSTLEVIGLIPKGTKQFGVGVSISLDKLISGLESEELERFRGGSRIVEVVICSMGHHALSREKISIMKDFWAHGISCTCLDGPETMEAAEEHCRELGSSFLVVLKDAELHSAFRVRIFEKERIHEKKMTKTELIELVKKNSRTTSEGGELHGSSSSTALNLKGPCEGHKGSFSLESGCPAPGHPHPHPAYTSNNNNIPSVNITFVLPENKDKNSTWKRRHENLMMSHITDTLSKLSKQQTVELLGIEANSTLIKTLSSFLQIHDKEQYNRSVTEILERQPRQKYVKAICDEIFDMVFDKTAPVIIIFGLMDNSYKLLI